MSEKVRQVQVVLNVKKSSYMPKRYKFSSLKVRRISCLSRLSLLPEMGQRSRILMSETT